jgi:hypothetical protein
MPHETILRTQALDVDARLADFNLDRDIIDDVRRAAVAARNSATPHHPPGHGGQMAFGDAVAVLRDALVGRGYRAVTEQNVSLCVHDGLGVAILIATGNAGTGDPTRTPTVERARGPRWCEAVERNQLSLALLDAPFLATSGRRRRTWVLLLRQSGDQMLAEFSLPRTVEAGRPALWGERNILPALELGVEFPAEAASEPTPEIEIDIVAR